METLSYTAVREQLAATMDRVCADHTPVVITRNGSQSVVMLSLADYESMQETTYLLSSPTNARRLLEGIEALESGGEVVTRDPSLLDQ